MIHRKYDPEKDFDACKRIWREVGWIEEENHEKAMEIFLQGCRVLVAGDDGNVDALVTSSDGSIKYLDRDVSLCAVCGVTTGYTGRRRGIAGRLTAELVALGASDGALVAGLGIFDQGYYDKLGFGTGPYETIVGFDPSDLNLDLHPPTPIRLTIDDWELIHRSRQRRMLSHGSTTLFSPEITRGEMLWSTNGFGLGYMDPDGDLLTHHFWCGRAKGEHGPYWINWMSYRDCFQLLELLSLIRNLGDQVHLVKMIEPPSIQLQDILKTPFRSMRKTEHSKYETSMRSMAFWQMRICDLDGCLRRTELQGDPVSFNLRLSDPIDRYLDDDAPWHGIAGSYVVTLGPESFSRKGHDPSLPVMDASVGAFTRMWLGVRSAESLRVTDELCGPEDLLKKIDRLLRIPVPRVDWEY
jgi:hypothetical protein